MNVEWLKSLAVKLRRTLAETGLAVSHGQALDLIAAIPGLRNWPEVMAFPERVAACRFDDAATERIARAVLARHSSSVPVERLMSLVSAMSFFFQRSSASSSMKRLIVTARYSGEGHPADKVIEVTVRLVWGPVPAATDPTAFFEAREAAYDGDPSIRDELFEWDRAEGAFADWFEVLELCEAYERVELWVDPTPNEQLLFIQLLTWLGSYPQIVEKLFVVHAEVQLDGRGPEYKQMIGTIPRKIGTIELSTAARALHAYCQPTPEAWFDLLRTELDVFPHLRRTVLLLLGELPARGTALGATEQFALEVVARGGIKPMRFCFVNTQDNPACVFHLFEEIRILNRLGGCVAPAIIGLQDTTFGGLAMLDSERRKLYLQSELSLSALGQTLVNGEDDFARHNAIHRWWGGTLLTNANLWRWDASTQALIAPR